MKARLGACRDMWVLYLGDLLPVLFFIFLSCLPRHSLLSKPLGLHVATMVFFPFLTRTFWSECLLVIALVSDGQGCTHIQF